VVSSRDITGREELEEQLRHQAHGRLTGLPSRALFTELPVNEGLECEVRNLVAERVKAWTR
jgi:hypothetical protein